VRIVAISDVHGKPSGNKGKKLSSEQKQKLSEMRKGKSIIKNAKSVILLETGQKFISIQEAAEKLNISKDMVYAAVRLGRTTRCGKTFNYINKKPR
jgi:transposase